MPELALQLHIFGFVGNKVASSCPELGKRAGSLSLAPMRTNRKEGSMKRFSILLSIAVILLAGLVSNARADRLGGPLATTLDVPGERSVYLDVPFVAGRPAVVNIAGTGRTMMQVNLYDSDGHIAVGTGRWDQKTAVMNVYRTGTFRVEITNIGLYDSPVFVTTN
jgi:hypothetical protein